MAADKLAAKRRLQGVVQGCVFLTLEKDTCEVNK